MMSQRYHRWYQHKIYGLNDPITLRNGAIEEAQPVAVASGVPHSLLLWQSGPQDPCAQSDSRNLGSQ